MATAGYRGAHHAVMPLGLAETAIQAGCPEACCSDCRVAWRRRTIGAIGALATKSTLGPDCNCGGRGEPGLVLDPFMGAGTTAVAAQSLGRDWLGIELNPRFAELARSRIDQAARAA